MTRWFEHKCAGRLFLSCAVLFFAPAVLICAEVDDVETFGGFDPEFPFDFTDEESTAILS